MKKLLAWFVLLVVASVICTATFPFLLLGLTIIAGAFALSWAIGVICGEHS